MNEDERITLKTIIMVANKINQDIDDVATDGACSYFRTLKNVEEIKKLAEGCLKRHNELQEQTKTGKIDLSAFSLIQIR